MALSIDDRFAIHELVARYGHACDDRTQRKPGANERWLSLFTDVAVFTDPTSVVRGKAELLNKLANSLPARANEQHSLVNVAVDEVTGDDERANVRATMLVFVAPADTNSVVVAFIGDYDKFVVRKSEGTWRIDEISVTDNILFDMIPRKA